MQKQKAIPKNVSMYQDDWLIVQAVNEKQNFRNQSQALRHIVNQYAIQNQLEVKECSKK